MSTFPKPAIGTQLDARADGSSQTPFRPFSNKRQYAVNTAALATTFLLSPTVRPSDTNLDAGDGSTCGFFSLPKLDPLPLLGLKFALGHASDPNDRMAQWQLLAHSEIRHSGRSQWITDVLANGYVIAGNIAVHSNSLLVPDGDALVFKWADTIVVSNDYTVGDSCRVCHDATNGSATLWLDFDSHPTVSIECTNLSDGSHGSASTGVTGCWRQM